jgi:hypothetical protein
LITLVTSDVPSTPPRRAHRARRVGFLALTVTLGSLLVAACDSEPTVQVGQAEPTTTLGGQEPPTTSPSTTTTAPGTPTIRTVVHGGVQFEVPGSWPVHDLAAEPGRCVRYDAHAVFLGVQGPDPDCPSRLVGRTETVHLQARSGDTQLAESLATQATTINGLPALVDPNAASAGAFTIVLPEQGLLVTITFGTERAAAERIVASLRAA